MNAQQLYPGTLYAWHPSPPKGRVPTGAVKVRLRKVEQSRPRGHNNLRTMCHITFLEGIRAGTQRIVRARQIVDFWDSYESEIKYLKEEENAEHERFMRILDRERKLRHAIAEKLGGGLSDTKVSIEDQTATVSLELLLAYLNLEEDA